MQSIQDPAILVFKEKHGSRYFLCNTPENFCQAAMKILKERIDEGWYYDDEDEPDLGLTRAREIYNNNDLESAYEFMSDRSDFEYEGMDIIYTEDY